MPVWIATNFSEMKKATDIASKGTVGIIQRNKWLLRKEEAKGLM